MTTAQQLISARLANPDAAAATRMAAAGWTGHNIALGAGQCTLPGQPLLEHDVRAHAIRRELQRFVARDGSLAGLRLLDLGCLEGGYSLEMARADMQVLGIEGRESNYRKCRMLAEYFALPNLQFELTDVKALTPARHGLFDAVLCLGLLYHLDQPMAFLEQLARTLTAPRALMFLDTHVAPPDEAALAAFEGRHALSPLQTMAHAGHAYEGRWYHEYPSGAAVPDEAWTAVSNARSFWPTEKALIAALCRAGFSRVFALYGNFEIGEEFALRARHSRAWYVVMKEPPAL